MPKILIPNGHTGLGGSVANRIIVNTLNGGGLIYWAFQKAGHIDHVSKA